jgi:hypothetical protein
MGDYTYLNPGQREPDQWNTGGKLQPSLLGGGNTGDTIRHMLPGNEYQGAVIGGGNTSGGPYPGFTSSGGFGAAVPGVKKPTRNNPIDKGIGQINNGLIQMTADYSAWDGSAPYMFNTDTGSITQASGRGGFGGGTWNAGDEGYQQLMDNYQQNNPKAKNLTALADNYTDVTISKPHTMQLAEGTEGVVNSAVPIQDVLGITEQDSTSLAAPLQSAPMQQPMQQPMQPVVSPLHMQQPLQAPEAPQTMQGIGALQPNTQVHNNTQPVNQAPLQDRQQSTGFGLSNPGTSYHTGLSQTPSSNPLYAQQDQGTQSVFTGPEQGNKAWWLR